MWLHTEPSKANWRSTLGLIVRLDPCRLREIQKTKENLQGLKNISWLTSRQLNRLDDALMTRRVAKEGIIFDKRRSIRIRIRPALGRSAITCRNRKGELTLLR